MEMTFVSTVILFLLVIDPFGNIPIFVSALKELPAKRRMLVVLREHLFAFVIFVVFMFFGREFLALLRLSDYSMGIAGGVVILLVALRMIFPSREGIFGEFPQGEPFFVPLAVPCIAGPSTLTAILLLVAQAPERRWTWILAMSVVMVVSAMVALGAGRLAKTLGDRGIAGFERLVGLMLAAVSVDMLLRGIEKYVHYLQIPT